MFLLKIPLYTLRLSLARRYPCDSGLINFHCLYKLSRNLIDFKIPQVIHLLSLCLCLLNLTVFSGMYLSFALVMVSSKIALEILGSVPRLQLIFSVIFAARISFLNISILSSFNLRIFINLGVWTLGCRSFMPVTHGQWSDMRDFTTIGANVKLGLGNIEGRVILGNKPCVHIKSRNSPYLSLSCIFSKSIL